MRVRPRADEATPFVGPAPAPTIPVRPGLIHALMVGAWGTTILALAWAISDSSALFVVFGAAACGIVVLPMLQKGYDLLSPWTFVALVVWIGCGVRSIFIGLGVDGSRSVDELFLLGHEPEYFVLPSLLYLTALGLMTTAYSRRAGRYSPGGLTHYLARYRFDQRVHLVVAVCAAVGALAFVLYAQRTGGLESTPLSAKRTTITGLDLADDYESHGGLRALGQLSSFAFWLLLAHYANRGQRHSLLTARGFVLLGLFVNAIALPVYSSARADVAYILLIAAALQLCLGQGGWRQRRVVYRVGLAIAIALVALTFLRVSASTSAIGSPSITKSAADAFVYTRTFSDIPTSSQIISSVPEVLPYRYGGTIAEWLIAPVPRSIWPDKPIVSSGPRLGITLFGTSAAGVPPGFIAEMYWNFGLAGSIAGAWIFGRILRRLYSTRIRDVRFSPASALVYCVVVLKFGVDVMTNSLGYALFAAVQSVAILAVLLAISGSAIRPSTGDGKLAMRGGPDYR